MPRSIHDNHLISYSVNEDEKTIVFETIKSHSTPIEYTNVIFTKLVAYFFENHSIQIGTILFDIQEVDTNSILDSNGNRFEEGKKWGWPGDWANSKEKAATYFRENNIKAYEISSSCGLSGWVLAKNMEILIVNKI